MSWKYNNIEIKSHSDLPDEITDIVYIITYTDNVKYVGKKSIRSERRLKPTKAQLAIRKNYKRVEMTTLPFVNYEGSSKENEGKTIMYKEILHLCTSKRTATYLEVKEMMVRGVLETDEYSNANCNGKWFDNALSGLYKGKI